MRQHQGSQERQGREPLRLSPCLACVLNCAITVSALLFECVRHHVAIPASPFVGELGWNGAMAQPALAVGTLLARVPVSQYAVV